MGEELYDHMGDDGFDTDFAENVNVATASNNSALKIELYAALRAGWKAALPRYGALQSKGAKIAQIAKSAKVGKAGGIALFAVVGATCAAALMVGAAVKMFIGRGGELNSAPLVPSNEKDLVEELDEKAPLQPKDTQAAAPSSKNRPDSP